MNVYTYVSCLRQIKCNKKEKKMGNKMSKEMNVYGMCRVGFWGRLLRFSGPHEPRAFTFFSFLTNDVSVCALTCFIVILALLGQFYPMSRPVPHFFTLSIKMGCIFFFGIFTSYLNLACSNAVAIKLWSITRHVPNGFHSQIAAINWLVVMLKHSTCYS